MNETIHYATAPQDRIPLSRRLIYGPGALVKHLLAAAIDGMVIVANLGLGLKLALMGLLGALSRFTYVLADLLIRYRRETRTNINRRK
jgi:hypothetical protein